METPVETVFEDGRLVGQIYADCGFQAFAPNGSHVGTYLTRERARRALEREPLKCERC